MEKAINIIVGIVVIAAAAFFCYSIQQEQLRRKEIDKKMSDNLQDQKEINKIIKEKLDSGKLNLMGLDEKGGHVFAKATLPSANGKKKNKKVDVAKHN